MDARALLREHKKRWCTRVFLHPGWDFRMRTRRPYIAWFSTPDWQSCPAVSPALISSPCHSVGGLQARNRKGIPRSCWIRWEDL